MRPELGLAALRDREVVRARPAVPSRLSGSTRMPFTFRARRRTRGSPCGSGASSSSTDVPSALASGPRWSTARRRLPFSSRLSVDGAMPAAAATASSDRPRSSRSALSRRRMRCSSFAKSAREVARTDARVQPSEHGCGRRGDRWRQRRPAGRAHPRADAVRASWSSTPGSRATRRRTRSAGCSARTTWRPRTCWPPAARSSPSFRRSGSIEPRPLRSSRTAASRSPTARRSRPAPSSSPPARTTASRRFPAWPSCGERP